MLVTGSSLPLNALGLQTDCMVVVLAPACEPYGPRLRIATPTDFRPYGLPPLRIAAPTDGLPYELPPLQIAAPTDGRPYELPPLRIATLTDCHPCTWCCI